MDKDSSGGPLVESPSLFRRHLRLFLTLVFVLTFLSFKVYSTTKMVVPGVYYNNFLAALTAQVNTLVTIIIFFIAIPVFGREHFLKSYMFCGFLFGLILPTAPSVESFLYYMRVNPLMILFLTPLVGAIIYLFWVRKKDYFFTSAKTSFAAGIILAFALPYAASLTLFCVTVIVCLIQGNCISQYFNGLG